MRHKSFWLDWPTSWQKSHVNGRIDDTIVSYLDSIRLAENKNFAILLLKNIDSYPSVLEIQSGYIDVWWIIHDGGLLFLLAFLLQQHRVWNKCTLRLFTICLPNQEPQTRKQELEQYVYQLRIHAEVHAVMVADQEISAFTKYRTMRVVPSKQLTPFDLTDDPINLEREHQFQRLFQNYPASRSCLEKQTSVSRVLSRQRSNSLYLHTLVDSHRQREATRSDVLHPRRRFSSTKQDAFCCSTQSNHLGEIARCPISFDQSTESSSNHCQCRLCLHRIRRSTMCGNLSMYSSEGRRKRSDNDLFLKVEVNKSSLRSVFYRRSRRSWLQVVLFSHFLIGDRHRKQQFR